MTCSLHRKLFITAMSFTFPFIYSFILSPLLPFRYLDTGNGQLIGHLRPMLAQHRRGYLINVLLEINEFTTPNGTQAFIGLIQPVPTPLDEYDIIYNGNNQILSYSGNCELFGADTSLMQQKRGSIIDWFPQYMALRETLESPDGCNMEGMVLSSMPSGLNSDTPSAGDADAIGGLMGNPPAVEPMTFHCQAQSGVCYGTNFSIMRCTAMSVGQGKGNPKKAAMSDAVGGSCPMGFTSSGRSSPNPHIDAEVDESGDGGVFSSSAPASSRRPPKPSMSSMFSPSATVSPPSSNSSIRTLKVQVSSLKSQVSFDLPSPNPSHNPSNGNESAQTIDQVVANSKVFGSSDEDSTEPEVANPEEEFREVWYPGASYRY
jgi:hypothetical protein